MKHPHVRLTVRRPTTSRRVRTSEEAESPPPLDRAKSSVNILAYPFHVWDFRLLTCAVVFFGGTDFPGKLIPPSRSLLLADVTSRRRGRLSVHFDDTRVSSSMRY